MILAQLLKDCPEELQAHQQQAIAEDDRQRCIKGRQMLKQVHNEFATIPAVKKGKARRVAAAQNYIKGDSKL